MFIYVAALSVVFLAQSGVTAFIQAPAKRASRTRATWGGASKSDAAKHLAGPLQWEWVPDDGVGSSSDDPTLSTNLSDGDVALARRRRGDRALLEGAWGREAVRHKLCGNQPVRRVHPGILH